MSGRGIARVDVAWSEAGAGRAVRAACALALVTTLYLLVAWGTQPGFYDGFAPPQPYRWVSPPPQSGASTTQPPVSAHQTVTSQPGVLQVVWAPRTGTRSCSSNPGPSRPPLS